MGRLWRYHLPWTLFVLGLACARNPLPAPSRPVAVSLDVLAVGQADAILLSSAANKHLLVDGGDAEDGPMVVAHLRTASACPLDLILLSHPHADHLGGLPRVIEECGTRRYMDGGYHHESKSYARLLKLLEEREIPLLRAEAGRQIDLGAGVVLTLLGPPQPFLQDGTEGANASSVVARLAVGKASVLLAGDANASEEAWLLSRGQRLRSTVLKVGHHGSRTSSTAAFLDAVSPRLAVVSNKPNAPKHPHPETLARLRAARAQVIETAKEGTIHLALDAEGVSWSSAKHPKQVPVP